MKVCINSRLRQIKTKTRGIDTQKWTLACICYEMGRIRVVGRAGLVIGHTGHFPGGPTH